MKRSVRTLVILVLWVILLAWTYHAIEKYLKEETTFNHDDIAEGFQWPVVNICPIYLENNTKELGTTFEEVKEAIVQTQTSFIQTWMQPKGTTADNKK